MSLQLNSQSPLFSITGLVFIFFLLLTFSAQVYATSYVGSSNCIGCHEGEYDAWQGSHHDLAMQVANIDTVLGDFSDVTYTYFDVTSRFYKKDGRFMVHTQGADGQWHEYEVKYTFGVYPLQQYLIELDGGHVQAFSLVWDTRTEAEGGQRWYHLYPDENIKYDDELHWTRLSQNWNSMCAECHSTGFEKNYDPAEKTYASTWHEIDVSCEACHGPGSDHISWAKQGDTSKKYVDSKGLVLQLDERKGVHWDINAKTNKPQRSEVRTTGKEIEMCARCHARRSPITNGYRHEDRFMDHYMPRMIVDGMYHSDGQIDNEVYVYGSFIQSKMHAAGVTCSDCHNPHSQALRQPGNGVCLQCHQADQYDSKDHHFHDTDSTGGSCVECHMPAKNYMVVDPRHDHSMRIPRPDLSVKLGTPNACNNCHQDKKASWAATQIKNWYQTAPGGYQAFAETLHAARDNSPGAEQQLAALINKGDTPAIARATAALELGPYLSAKSLDVLPVALGDDDPSVRASAVSSLIHTPLGIRVRLAFPMLSDPVRAVRIEAARVLSSIPAGDLEGEQRLLLEKATQEYLASQTANAERPEAQSNLGNYYAAQGKTEQAEQAYQISMELEPAYIMAYVNLADLYREQGREEDVSLVLTKAIEVVPNSAVAHYALGLSQVRQQRMDEALKHLKRASRLEPNNARYSYLYAVALNSTGQSNDALDILKAAHKRHPGDTDIVTALMTINRDLGRLEQAEKYGRKLQSLSH